MPGVGAKRPQPGRSRSHCACPTYQDNRDPHYASPARTMGCGCQRPSRRRPRAHWLAGVVSLQALGVTACTCLGFTPPGGLTGGGADRRSSRLWRRQAGVEVWTDCHVSWRGWDGALSELGNTPRWRPCSGEAEVGAGAEDYLGTGDRDRVWFGRRLGKDIVTCAAIFIPSADGASSMLYNNSLLGRPGPREGRPEGSGDRGRAREVGSKDADTSGTGGQPSCEGVNQARMGPGDVREVEGGGSGAGLGGQSKGPVALGRNATTQVAMTLMESPQLGEVDASSLPRPRWERPRKWVGRGESPGGFGVDAQSRLGGSRVFGSITPVVAKPPAATAPGIPPDPGPMATLPGETSEVLLPTSTGSVATQPAGAVSPPLEAGATSGPSSVGQQAVTVGRETDFVGERGRKSWEGSRWE
ncbi:unnamed protein product, partial [Discosporangium mesarthrocarpum]